MVLLWFFLGLLLAFGLARYNESNKLFWTLFVSFTTGIAGGAMYKKITSPGTDSNGRKIEVLSTQELQTCAFPVGDMYVTGNVLTTQISSKHYPVSKSTALQSSDHYRQVGTSKTPHLTISPVARGRPFEYFDTS